MKRYIKTTKDTDTGVVDMSFDVYLSATLTSVAATAIVDLPKTRAEADPLAVENYDSFVECVEEIFSHYDFQYVKDPYRSEFSSYYYYAPKSQIEAKNVPKYVRVRISSHVEQHKSEEHRAKIKNRIKEDLDEIKLPDTKKKQRYMPLRITADRKLDFTSYEEVLNYAEERVRELFEWLGILDLLSSYDELGPF